MKKITLLLFVALLSSITAMAQYSFPGVAGPITTTGATPVVVAINDAANAAGVPAGTYETYSITADWVNTGNAWSNEERLSVVTAGGATAPTGATSGATGTTASTSLTFTGTLAAPYDPSIDGALELSLNRTYTSTADFTNIVVTIIPALTCTSPEATAVLGTTDCVAGTFMIDVDVTDLGDATSLTISNDGGVASTPVTAVGMVSVGPFASGSEVVVTVEHDQDNLCNLELGAVIFNCPPSNDECDSAIALTVNPDYACGTVTAGTNAAATESPEMETSGAITGTPLTDVWYSFVATATGHRISLTNVTAVTGTSTDMGFALYDATSGCGATLAAPFDDSDPNTLNATGFTIGTTYLLRIYGWSGTQAFSAQTTFDICIGTPPSCLEPTAGSASAITETTADLGWTENNTATTWNIEWGVDGFTQGMGTTITGTEDNPYTLSGLTATTAYDFYVQSDCGGGDLSDWAGPYSFTTSAPPTANDECANAIDLDAFINADGTCTITYTGSNVGATNSAGEVGISAGCTYFGTDPTPDDIWFTLTVPATGGFTYDDIVTPGFSSIVEVYTGVCGGLTAITPVNCTNAGGLKTFDGLTAGDTVFIRYWDYASDNEGGLEFCLGIAPPANDECAGAVELFVGTEVMGDTTNATDSGVIGSCPAAGGDQDIWYSFVATATMATEGAIFSTTADHLALYDDCAANTANEIACLVDAENSPVLVSGDTYYVRAYNNGTANKVAGPITITLMEGTLSTTDFNGKTIFSYYPNPVNNTLTLNAQQAITNVTVFNMLGQEVIRTAPNAVSKDVDMSNLQSGAYFVQVTVGSAVETVKIIKN